MDTSYFLTIIQNVADCPPPHVPLDVVSVSRANGALQASGLARPPSGPLSEAFILTRQPRGSHPSLC